MPKSQRGMGLLEDANTDGAPGVPCCQSSVQWPVRVSGPPPGMDGDRRARGFCSREHSKQLGSHVSLRHHGRSGRRSRKVPVAEEAGERGQGRVFLAADERGFQYALKIPHVDNTSRFQRELDAAREVQSSHVARVWDYDLSCDPPFIAYQVVPGERLDAALDKRELTPLDLVSIFRDVALGLVNIHRVRPVRYPSFRTAT